MSAFQLTPKGIALLRAISEAERAGQPLTEATVDLRVLAGLDMLVEYRTAPPRSNGKPRVLDLVVLTPEGIAVVNEIAGLGPVIA